MEEGPGSTTYWERVVDRDALTCGPKLSRVGFPDSERRIKALNPHRRIIGYMRFCKRLSSWSAERFLQAWPVRSHRTALRKRQRGLGRTLPVNVSARTPAYVLGCVQGHASAENDSESAFTKTNNHEAEQNRDAPFLFNPVRYAVLMLEVPSPNLCRVRPVVSLLTARDGALESC